MAVFESSASTPTAHALANIVHTRGGNGLHKFADDVVPRIGARRLELSDGAVELCDAYRDQDRHPTVGLCNCGHGFGGAAGDPAAPEKSDRYRRNSTENDPLEEVGSRLTLHNVGHSHDDRFFAHERVRSRRRRLRLCLVNHPAL